MHVVCRAPRVLFKLDKAGMGEELLLADLPANKGLSLAGFSHDMFLQVSVWAGACMVQRQQRGSGSVWRTQANPRLQMKIHPSWCVVR